MFCPVCGDNQPEENMYCSNDGTLLVRPKKAYDINVIDSRHCRDCGQSLDKSAHFCPACGTITSNVKLLTPHQPAATQGKPATKKAASGLFHPELLTKASLKRNAFAALKLLALPLVLIWILALVARDSMLSSEMVNEVTYEIGRRAVENIIGVGDMFLIMNGTALLFEIRLDDFSEIMSFSFQLGQLLTLSLLLIAMFLGAWLLTTYDRSFQNNHHGLTAILTGVFYFAGLLLLGTVMGNTTRMNVDGEVAVITNSYSVLFPGLILGVLISVMALVALLMINHRKRMLQEADRLMTYGSSIITGITVGLTAYVLTFAVNTMIIFSRDDFTMDPSQELTFWDSLLQSPFTAITMLQGVSITFYESMDGEQMINTVDEIRFWFTDIIRQQQDLFYNDYLVLMDMDISTLSPILWSLIVPVVVLVAGGWILTNHLKRVTWKEIIAVSLSTAIVVTLMGLFSQMKMAIEGEDFYNLVGYYMEYEIMWFSSFLVMTGVSFVVYYLVNWFRS